MLNHALQPAANAGKNERSAVRRVGGRFAPALLVALALLHGLLYVWLVPPWQTPDEPTQFEYAALISTLKRLPTPADIDPKLERRIADSLVRQRFFEYLVGHGPEKPPHSLDEVRAVFFMPRQVGSDPPLYFTLAALPIATLANLPIESQLLALRLLGALLVAGAALCAYQAAGELLPGNRGFALAVGLLVTLHPMFVFAGVGAGNDGLANLIGAALCWAALRTRRAGFSARRGAALLVLALLGALTKRTLLPELLLLAAIGGFLALGRLARAPLSRTTRLGLGGLLLLACILGARSFLASSRIHGAAAEWNDYTTKGGAPRVLSAPGTGQPALELRAGHGATQALPPVTAEWAQNQELYFSARVWTANGAARGRLMIDFGWAKTELPIEADQRGQIVQVHTFVPLYCPDVIVEIHSDTGTLYADQLSAESDRQRGLNLLANGNLTAPHVSPESPREHLTRYLRLRELAWAWRSGRLLEPPPLGWDLARIFFVSFWGQFGWMSLPLVGATPWEGALDVLCIGGLVGTLGVLVGQRCPPWRRGAVVLLLALILAGLLLPLLNAYTQPRNQVIQQGRYLFPTLTPIALLLALGWRALLPPRMRVAALVAWSVWWALFAASAIGLILRAYYS